MSRRIDIRAAARADLEHYFLFISNDSIEAAIRFLDAADATFERIADWPGMGRPRERPSLFELGVRSLSIEGFPNHLVFYRVPDEHSVRILRIRHAAMDHDAISMEDEE